MSIEECVYAYSVNPFIEPPQSAIHPSASRVVIKNKCAGVHGFDVIQRNYTRNVDILAASVAKLTIIGLGLCVTHFWTWPPTTWPTALGQYNRAQW